MTKEEMIANLSAVKCSSNNSVISNSCIADVANKAYTISCVSNYEEDLLHPETIMMEEYSMSFNDCCRSVCRIQLNEEDSEKLIRYYKKNGHTTYQPFRFHLSAAMKPVPAITEVKSYDNKTTVVFFSDGTKEHANCSENDTYSLEYGISICLLKKLLGGNETYKKIVNTAAKSYREKQIAEESEKLRKKEEHEARMQAEQEAARRRKEAEERREKEETEKQINIMAEAFRRAMQQNNEVS